MKVDFVSPPFAGHLYPALELARSLQENSTATVRVLSTSQAERSIAKVQLPRQTLLAGRESVIDNLGYGKQKIGSNPWRLYSQFRENLSLMHQLASELREAWTLNRPDLVITDFVVPVAGLVATEMNIRWWTGMPSPCVLETPDGTPSYLGGLLPRSDIVGKLRDAGGRMIIRMFKQTVASCVMKDLRKLGFKAVYKADGTESIYSSEKVLCYGLKEFEFPCSWPVTAEFIGPLTGSPFDQEECALALHSKSSRKKVLVSLGTQLMWAKQKSRDEIFQFAQRFPEIDFHLTAGDAASMSVTGDRMGSKGNCILVPFIPYRTYLSSYNAAIIHAGTGVTYACIENGVPMLAWPRDFDQFDNAARIVYHGLGERIKKLGDDAEAKLRSLIDDKAKSDRIQYFKLQSRNYDAKRWLQTAVKNFKS